MKLTIVKKLFLYILPLLLLHTVAPAQTVEDGRTLQTRIADVLAGFPAADSAQFYNLMDEMANLGESGIREMSQMLSPPGEGDNTQLEYALGGLSFFAMQENKEELRFMVSNAYSQALDEVSAPEIKAFLIRQLQVVGKEEAVPVLQTYLNDARLCAPASRAMTNINTPEAQQALLNALPSAQDNCQYSLVQALGDVQYTDAVDALTNLVGSSDGKLEKLALNALAKIGSPSSEDILAAEAEKAGYILNETNATAAYLLWAKRMVEAGNIKPVEKLAKSLVKKLDGENQVHARTAALKLLVDANSGDAVPALLKASIDKNAEFRAAALKFAAGLQDGQLTDQWIKQLKKASPEAKADIIAMLGNSNSQAAYPAVVQALESNEPVVKLAAIKASAQLGQESALPTLLEMMQSAGKEEVDAIKTALLSMKGESLVPEVADALPEAPAYAKAALLEILGARKASQQSSKVLALADAEDSLVRNASLHALGNMATQENLPALYPLLMSASTEEEIASIQAAIATGLGVEDKSRSTDAILAQMAQAPPDKKHMYYNILAGIGSQKALEAVVLEYQQGNAVAKKAAIKALSSWEGFSAGRELLKIAQSAPESPIFDQALKGYIRQVSLSSNSEENKYLLLREAMEIANTAEQKRIIIQEIGKSNTFPALLYAGKFLGDEEVQQAAAHAVMNIALADTKIYGEVVRELLTKSMNMLEGQESAYLKESVKKHLSELPDEPGFVPLFNGEDLTGWKGLVANPLERAEMNEKSLAQKQKTADEEMRESWIVENGELIFTGKGNNIATVKDYGDLEMYVDWKIFDDGHKEGDAGIYLRGTPQVQIWDTSRVDAGAQVGSGGLYNNETHPSKPSKVADNPLGEWNTFHITMIGDRVSVSLNGEQVVDNVVLENYWNRSQPIFPEEQIELQAHGSRVAYRDIYIREIPRAEPFELSEEEKEEDFKVLFDGTNMHHWQGNTTDYVIEGGHMVVRPQPGSRGNLFTKEQYSDFIFRFEFQLTPGANNGLAIRAPLEGDAAYTGMELQILDNEADIYKSLEPYQYHGSVYGVITAERGHLKPLGEWNYQEVVVQGPNIKVTLNGHVILDGNIAEASENGTLDGKDHPGLKRDTGYIGFLGHGSVVKLRNMRAKDLSNK